MCALFVLACAAAQLLVFGFVHFTQVRYASNDRASVQSLSVVGSAPAPVVAGPRREAAPAPPPDAAATPTEAAPPPPRALSMWDPALHMASDSAVTIGVISTFALMALTLLLTYGTTGNPLQLLIWSLIGVTALFLKIFFFALIISVILSWVAPGSRNPGAELVNDICEPALAPFRKILPNLGGLDLSPIFAFLALKLIDMLVINNLAAMTMMPEILRILI